ncbi:Tat pathway signal sequence domain protein [delta proteobacterium NaphS2]|nr:Tat pathway signal sequence domain protein [delta proteobacterium NaphS2]
MRRRAFLKTSLLGLASAFLPPKVAIAASEPGDLECGIRNGVETSVVLAGVARGADQKTYKTAIREAAEAATDFSWLSKGDAVFIKPVLNSGNPYPATTSPEAIGTMVTLLLEKGAGRVVVGDMSGIQYVKLTPEGVNGSTRDLMKASGMAAAARKAGAELHFPEEAGWNAFYEDLPAEGSNWKAGLMMPGILRDMDHIVLMPRCSRHVLAGSTLGLKAAVGYWRTDTRLEYHHDAATFQEKTAEGNTVGTLLRKQRLVISAADKIFASFGPDKGYTVQPETGLVIASQSVVAHDMTSLAWLLLNRESIPGSEKDIFSDPYESQFIVSIGNHFVVGKLGGWTAALTPEELKRNDINTIWDDRVLNRAYQVLGGRPAINMKSANEAVSRELQERLKKMTLQPV